MATKKLRLVLEQLEQRQLLTAANLWFVDSGQSLGTNTDGAEFGDLDGDGDLDALVGCRDWPGGPACAETQVWLNDGNGQFSKGWSVAETNVGRFALGDLDGDGDLDAYVAKASPAAPDNPTFGERDSYSKVWFNDGQGRFQDSGQRLDRYAPNDGAFAVTLGDVDNDGDLDAVTAHPVGASRVLLNDGSGNFADSGQRLATARWTLDIALGDVDGDNDIDAYFARGVDSPVDLLYLNDGQGNFTDSRQRLDASFTVAAQLADLDSDGDLDVFLVNGDELAGVSQPNRVYFNDGQGNFTDSGQSLGLAISNSVKLADLDSDGDIDAFVANGGITRGSNLEQPNEIWLNDGSGFFTLGQLLGDAASYRVALGDIDKDGDLDAFIGNIGQDNRIWFNTQAIAGDANRDGVFDSSDLALVFQAGEYEDAILGNSAWAEGDWNGDGDFDSSDLVFAFQQGTYSLGAAAAEKAVPFKGSLQAVESNDVQGTTLFVEGSGSGNATHLGRLTVTYESEVDLLTLAGSGSAHFIAANGDSLFTEVIGQATPTENPDVLSIAETYTITGGTGRFADATGSFTVERLLNTGTSVTSGSFGGTIVIPNGK